MMQSPKSSAYTRGAASLQRQSAKEFGRALHCGEKAAAKNKPELAVGWCRYAATVAWSANPGFFFCHDIEQLLADIGRTYLKSISAPPASPGPPRRFLHLMSTAYETGGHTRVVSRWIETCAQHAPMEHHSILISMQADEPLPAWLGNSARKTGGEVIKLASGMSWLQMAAEIRSKALEFDAVVLHIHPNDPLPNIALYDQPRPVLFFSHADYAFSLGTDVARVVAEIRTVAHDFSVLYRSPASRKVLLPVPLLDVAHATLDKVDVRKKLGLPVNSLIVLTIGELSKFIPIPGCNFPELIRSICAANSRILIVAVGPSESEPFPELKRQTGGRFMPVGLVKDPNILELYYRAANIFLDSIPVSSITAALDAARHGLPVQRLAIPTQSLLWSDDPALDSVLRGASTQDELVAGVLEWLEWPEDKRSELGGRFRAAVLEGNCGASWKSKWLDPAIRALDARCDDQFPTSLQCTDGGENPFLVLAGLEWEAGWPTSMLIARATLSARLPLRMRLLGVLRSIGPLLFGTAEGGAFRTRFLMFITLLSAIVPGKKSIVRKFSQWS
ncbi:MAG: hypothetical protein WCF30_09485 [Terracidiphilus sp.]